MERGGHRFRRYLVKLSELSEGEMSREHTR